MKKFLILTSILLSCIYTIDAQTTIAAAKALSPGSTITVSGYVTNGSELGSVIRYLQDGTGGIAAYGSDVSILVPGDSIVISGTLKDYNGLLEIDPIESVTVISSGHELPAAAVLTPNQYSDTHEGMIIKTLKAKFSVEGKFNSGQNYEFTASTETGQVRITDASSPFVGSVISQDTVNITGILSEYNGQFQVLVRQTDDIKSTKSVSFTSAPEMSNLSTTGFTLSWTTDSASTTEAFIGNTSDFELTPIKDAKEVTSHELNVTGGSASTIFYVKPFSVRKGDTAFAGTSVYVTQSASTGVMKAYFTQPVDQNVSTGTNATYVNNGIADTLINFINRASESIDMSIYNIDTYENSKIVTALNDAFARGVDVRVIYDSETAHTGIADLNPGIGRLSDPVEGYPNYGIMHNKYVVFDVNSDNNSWVWTGSTNFTTNQLTKDANNVVVIQDKSLALAYTLEFNEMFGSETNTPSATMAKFGPDKADNTPHNFIIGGKDVELYFSPSDGTHNEILNTINSATIDIHSATMTMTKADAASAIVAKHEAGVTSMALLDNNVSEYDQVELLAIGLKGNFRISDGTGILHHKYLIVDQSNVSTALVLTGSHNWTGSAQERNDENTLIIHDQELANEFYQEFTERFKNGVYIYPVCTPDSLEMTEGQSSVNIDVLGNDLYSGDIDVEKLSGPDNGLGYINTNYELFYQPNNDFLNGIDTVWYKLSAQLNSALACSTWVKIDVNKGGENSLETLQANSLTVYPNPCNGKISIILPETDKDDFQYIVFNTLGKEVLRGEIKSNGTIAPVDLTALSEGIFHLRLISAEGNIYQNKLVIRK